MTDPVPFGRRSPFEHAHNLTELPVKTTWAVTEEGLTIYMDGQPVCVVPVSSFGRLIYALAEKMRG